MPPSPDGPAPPAFDAEEFRAGYIGEVEDQLSSAGEQLVGIEGALREGHGDPRAVRAMFRALHTIKGLSAMVGVEPLVELAHGMEEGLRALDRAGAMPTPAAVELLRRGLGELERRVRALADDRLPEPAPAALLERLTALGPSDEDAWCDQARERIGLPDAILARLDAAERRQLLEAGARNLAVWRLELRPTPERVAAGLTITEVRRRLAERAELVKVLPTSVPPSDDAPGGLSFVLLLLASGDAEDLARLVEVDPVDVRPVDVRPAPALASEPWEPVLLEGERPADGEERGGMVRVGVARLDDALEKASSLLTTRLRLERVAAALAQDGVDVRELRAVLGDQARQLSELRAAVMRTRLVSVTSLLARVPLLLRGLRRISGKDVHLELEAGDAELDKAVAERLLPAIVHLVRNAVDHGIEPPEERVRLGKPARGLLRIRCEERAGGRLELTISDDGRGVDAGAVARRAAEVTGELREPRSPAELLDLLTLPGVSTRGAVSATSGRGVGMDIVRAIACDRLGGDLTLATAPGRGTSFTLTVPLDLTIVDALAFGSGGQTFVTPVAALAEIVELEERRVTVMPAPPDAAVAPAPRGRWMELRGQPVPVLELNELLGLGAGAGPRRKALIVQRGDQRYAVAIDRLLGQQEVVMRPLEDPLVRVPGFSGATDLGDGRPALVLDLADLPGLHARSAAEAA